MKNCRESDSGFECVVVVSLVKGEGFTHDSHPPVNGPDASSVTSSTNGISMPSAFALEYTSLAVDPLAINRSPSSATHWPEYLSRFSCNHLSDFSKRLACACDPWPSPFVAPLFSSHRRIFSCSAAGSCSMDLMIWSRLESCRNLAQDVLARASGASSCTLFHTLLNRILVTVSLLKR